MRSLWNRGTARVREVHEDLLPERKLAYTTVMTVLDRLFQKGIVQRRKSGRAHIYRPAFSEGAVRTDAVTVLVDSFFGGSEEALKRYLEGQTEISARVRLDVKKPHRPIEDSLL